MRRPSQLALQIEYGKKYLIKWREQDYKIGEHIQTRGNDEEYPVFVLEDGKQISVARERVIQEIKSEMSNGDIP